MTEIQAVQELPESLGQVWVFMFPAVGFFSHGVGQSFHPRIREEDRDARCVAAFCEAANALQVDVLKATCNTQARMSSAEACSLLVVELQRFFLDGLKEAIPWGWFHTDSCCLAIKGLINPVMIVLLDVAHKPIT